MSTFQLLHFIFEQTRKELSDGLSYYFHTHKIGFDFVKSFDNILFWSRHLCKAHEVKYSATTTNANVEGSLVDIFVKYIIRHAIY